MKFETAAAEHEVRSALFSNDLRYRYQLVIRWDALLPDLTVIGLNPSTATHLVDDPTLRRVKGFARSLGFGGVVMLNVFAFRSTDPKELFKAADPVGEANTIPYLHHTGTGTTVAAWGGGIQSRKWKHYYRGHEISQALPYLKCFRRTKAGHPEHPLYLPKECGLEPFCYGSAA